jgi:hypothetical protein
MKLLFKPSQEAIEAAVNEYAKEKDGVYIQDFENALKAAYAIDAEGNHG